MRRSLVVDYAVWFAPSRVDYRESASKLHSFHDYVDPTASKPSYQSDRVVTICGFFKQINREHYWCEKYWYEYYVDQNSFPFTFRFFYSL